MTAEIFVNEVNNQVRAAHKILGYDPIQKSFGASKYVIRAKDPRLRRITVSEDGFSIPEESSTPEGTPLASSFATHQAAEVGREDRETE